MANAAALLLLGAEAIAVAMAKKPKKRKKLSASKIPREPRDEGEEPVDVVPSDDAPPDPSSDEVPFPFTLLDVAVDMVRSRWNPGFQLSDADRTRTNIYSKRDWEYNQGAAYVYGVYPMANVFADDGTPYPYVLVYVTQNVAGKYSTGAIPLTERWSTDLNEMTSSIRHGLDPMEVGI